MYGYGNSMLPINSAKSVEALNQSNYERFASVKQRINGSKRISMEELERLMERQGQGTSQFQPIPIHEVFHFLFYLSDFMILHCHSTNYKSYQRELIL